MNFFNYRYYFSNKYNLIKFSFYIKVLDQDEKMILPSNLILKYKKHLICYIKINKINIYSLAIIEKDSYFKCVEFSNLGENIKLGVFVYETPNNSNEAVKKYTLFLMDKYLFK